MRICELVQVGTETITNVIMVDDYNEDGEVVGQHEETVAVEKPIMETVYRDATPEEEAETRAFEESMPEPQPTIDERVESLKSSTDELADTVLALCDLIEGDK